MTRPNISEQLRTRPADDAAPADKDREDTGDPPPADREAGKSSTDGNTVQVPTIGPPADETSDASGSESAGDSGDGSDVDDSVSYGDGDVAPDESSGDSPLHFGDENQADVDVDGIPDPPPPSGPSLADIERLKSSFVRGEGPPEIDPDGGSFGNLGTPGLDSKVEADGPAELGDIYSGLRAAGPTDQGDDLQFGTGADPALPEPQGFGDHVVSHDLGGFDGEPTDGPTYGPAFELGPVAHHGKGLDQSDDGPLLARNDPKSTEDDGSHDDAVFDFG